MCVFLMSSWHLCDVIIAYVKRRLHYTGLHLLCLAALGDCRRDICLTIDTKFTHTSISNGDSYLDISNVANIGTAEGPRDASCQLKSCQLSGNSAETTCTTSPEQIEVMKLDV